MRRLLFFLLVPLLARIKRRPAPKPRRQVVHGQWISGEPTLTFPNDDLPTGHLPTLKETPKS